jgi:hypothetical protein
MQLESKLQVADSYSNYHYSISSKHYYHKLESDYKLVTVIQQVVKLELNTIELVLCKLMVCNHHLHHHRRHHHYLNRTLTLSFSSFPLLAYLMFSQYCLQQQVRYNFKKKNHRLEQQVELIKQHLIMFSIRHHTKTVDCISSNHNTTSYNYYSQDIATDCCSILNYSTDYILDCYTVTDCCINHSYRQYNPKQVEQSCMTQLFLMYTMVVVEKSIELFTNHTNSVNTITK